MKKIQPTTRRRVITAAVMATALLFTGVAASQGVNAAQPESGETMSTQAINTTGYYFTNVTSSTLTRASYEHGDTGWSLEPPVTIAPGATAHVEINVPSAFYESGKMHEDDSNAVYTSSNGQTVKFVFDVTTRVGSPNKVMADHSQVIVNGVAYDSSGYVTKTLQRGQQTILFYRAGM